MADPTSNSHTPPLFLTALDQALFSTEQLTGLQELPNTENDNNPERLAAAKDLIALLLDESSDDQDCGRDDSQAIVASNRTGCPTESEIEEFFFRRTRTAEMSSHVRRCIECQESLLEIEQLMFLLEILGRAEKP
jgi:hypothetical protein